MAICSDLPPVRLSACNRVLAGGEGWYIKRWVRRLTVLRKKEAGKDLSAFVCLYTLKDAERSFFLFVSYFLYLLFPYFLGSTSFLSQVSLRSIIYKHFCCFLGSVSLNGIRLDDSKRYRHAYTLDIVHITHTPLHTSSRCNYQHLSLPSSR